MVIRDAMPDDAESIAELNAAAWRIAFQGVVNDDYLATHDGRPHRRRDALEHPTDNSIHLVAENQAGVVGWLMAQPSQDDDRDPAEVFEIGACYVIPTSWRQGIGRLLMNALFERLASSQWNEITLWAARDTPASHAFYRSLGFDSDSSMKNHTIADGSTVPVIRFVCALPK